MITADIQKLEPGNLVELFEIDATVLGATHQRFHGYADFGVIYWQGNSYEPWAIKVEGFERTGDGQQPNPTITVGNIGVDGSGNPVPGVMSALCLAFDDLVGAKVIRRRTLAKYLDAANFPPGAPGITPDPTQELPVEIWIVEQKSAENPEALEFTLSNPLNFDGQQLPGRQIIASICPWLWKGGYRGPYCGYTGSRYFDAKDNPVADPTLDRCGGRVRSCKLRFDPDPLNYGGFESADRTGK